MQVPVHAVISVGDGCKAHEFPQAVGCPRHLSSPVPLVLAEKTNTLSSNDKQYHVAMNLLKKQNNYKKNNNFFGNIHLITITKPNSSYTILLLEPQTLLYSNLSFYSNTE